MTIGVAIIGGGIFAREAHLPAVLATPSLTLKAIYSRTLKSAQTLQPPTSVDYYSDDSGSGKTYHDLLLREDIQAVIVALPIPSQPEHIEAALAAGKHVLSEKPIAKDLARARKLIEFSKSGKVKGKATWCVAENFRFLEPYQLARREVEALGGVKGWSVVSLNYVAGGKYYETAWRKVPEYQGGFLLDGGVHTIAAIRLLLGPEAAPTSLTAYTTLLQKHLPPHDTINSIWRSESGVSGTFSMSFGATYASKDISVFGDKGSVTIANDKVIVRKFEDGKQEVVKEHEAEWKDWGVTNEVRAWAEALEKGRPDPMQAPEQALADLELLELMLVSGEKGGAVQSLKLQV